jgi:hypothetical protein
MSDFLSLQNFKMIFLILNKYVKKVHNLDLNLDELKNVISQTMITVNNNYKNQTLKNLNKIVLSILKETVNKKIEKDGLGEEKQITYGEYKQESENKNYNGNNYKYEKKFERVFKQENNIDAGLVIKKDLDFDIKKAFTYNSVKTFVEHDLSLPPVNYNEQLLIERPKEYNDLLAKLNNKILHEHNLSIDSRDRNYDVHPNEYTYSIELNEIYHNAVSIELKSAIIPNSEYIINASNNLLHFKESNSTELVAIITPSDYTISELATEVELQLNSSGSSSYTVSSTNIYSRISKLFTGSSNQITSNTGTPHLAFDGDINTEWTSTTFPSFIIYEFDQPETVERYRFVCGEATGFPQDWTIDVSNDLVNWYSIDTQTSQVVTQFVYKTYNVTNSIRARYVRFNITDSNDATNIHISELEFFTAVSNRLEISSDLTGGDGIFTLLFNKNNTIGKIIGFNKETFSGFNSYTSIYDINLQQENAVYLFIDNFDNIDAFQGDNADNLGLIPLDSQKGEYVFFNASDVSNTLYVPRNPIKIEKLNITFKKLNGDVFDFRGLEHSLLFEIKTVNFQTSSIEF